MASTTSEELSLINDAEFLEELEQLAEADELFEPTRPAQTTYGAAFAGLESGLPMQVGAPDADVPHHERALIGHPYDDEEEEAAGQPAPVEQRIPFMAAALVLLVCLTAGAATAAVVFHDRLAQFTAPRAASR